ncbi:MAG: tRNA (adenosine(37)-N6)-threonylcarbamoyltransferase complex ATPase subunit type 1 TsaE [Bacteroidales bacterium]|nr:tRNA (adenosine(37)-N6)-threonylcarbamoyltransferase complex ATPase subunit type 1 TsaE [Bacteroidales bacterium]
MVNKIIIRGLSDIESAAARFLELKGRSSVIALYGGMGAGKTTFTKALCRVLGVVDGVNSPTFNIVNEYRTDSGETVYHFDFYRIESIAEALDIGFEEYLYSGDLCIIEWPEKVEQILPDDTLKVQISVLNNHYRELTFGSLEN